jgi:sugar phosphate isomerase/epimerase
VTSSPTRRQFVLTLGAASLAPAAEAAEFQICCMTLAYSSFPIDRAFKGIAGAGYKYVAWGPRHSNENTIAMDAPASKARELAVKTRDHGLEPLLTFAVHYPERPDAVEVYRRRIEQTAAAKIPYLLSFGSPKNGPDSWPVWIRTFRQLGPIARDAGITIVVKQHGGTTGTGADCERVVREVGDAGVQMFYDAGNTRWYVDVDPLEDIRSCAGSVRGFAIKDFRGAPKKTTCGPGFGEIDHYKLLGAVARTGRKIPLAIETLWEPYVGRPSTPDGIDSLARRAREYLDSVARGLAAS